MKKVVILILSMISSLCYAGVNGSSGNSVGQLVTVEVCDLDVQGICKKVTYEVRPPSENQTEEKCMIPFGEAGEVPCPTQYGVPQWLMRSLD